MSVKTWLASLWVPPDAWAWASQFEDPQAAWDACDRGDWMAWLLGRLAGPAGDPTRKKLTVCACACAQLAAAHAQVGDKTPALAIGKAEANAIDAVPLEDVEAVSYAAYASGDEKSGKTAAAAEAAACAAYTALAYTPDASAKLAIRRTAEAVAAAGILSEPDVLLACADIVREHYPKHPMPAQP